MNDLLNDRRSRFNKALYVVALLTALATVPLIFLGGQVTTRQAGLSVPDWPNSYGYNMWLFPPSLWKGGIFWEHTHRLKGTLVGLLSILLAIQAWRVEPRKWVRVTCYGVLAAVIVQGIVGGLRVIWTNLDLAIIHACMAQAFFSLVVFTCVVTSRWWHEAGKSGEAIRHPVGKSLITLAAVTVIAIYLQLIVGAVMRHNDAGLAIPGIGVYGKLLPPVNEAGVERVNDYRKWAMHAKPVSLYQLWSHFGHRTGAVIVSGLVIALVTFIARKYREHRSLFLPAMVLLGLLLAQVTLGVLTIYFGVRDGLKPYEITTFHVLIGALVLVTTVLILTRAFRLRAIAAEPVEARDLGTMQGVPQLQGI